MLLLIVIVGGGALALTLYESRTWSRSDIAGVSGIALFVLLVFIA